MTENQGRFIIRILMVILMTFVHHTGLGVSSKDVWYNFEKLQKDYNNGQIF